MKIIDTSYLVKTYRSYKLREGTPDFLRTMFVERKGNFFDLSNKYGKDNVEAKLYLGHIVKKYDGTWEITRDGKDDIDIFHTRPTPFQCLKSILFGYLAKLF